VYVTLSLQYGDCTIVWYLLHVQEEYININNFHGRGRVSYYFVHV
jgi:hypothetical protein